MTIRAFKFEDREVVDQIYAEGIATGTAVFSEERSTWEQWDAAIENYIGKHSQHTSLRVLWFP